MENLSSLSLPVLIIMTILIARPLEARSGRRSRTLNRENDVEDKARHLPVLETFRQSSANPTCKLYFKSNRTYNTGVSCTNLPANYLRPEENIGCKVVLSSQPDAQAKTYVSASLCNTKRRTAKIYLVKAECVPKWKRQHKPNPNVFESEHECNQVVPELRISPALSKDLENVRRSRQGANGRKSDRSRRTKDNAQGNLPSSFFMLNRQLQCQEMKPNDQVESEMFVSGFNKTMTLEKCFDESKEFKNKIYLTDDFRCVRWGQIDQITVEKGIYNNLENCTNEREVFSGALRDQTTIQNPNTPTSTLKPKRVKIFVERDADGLVCSIFEASRTGFAKLYSNVDCASMINVEPALVLVFDKGCYIYKTDNKKKILMETEREECPGIQEIYPVVIVELGANGTFCQLFKRFSDFLQPIEIRRKMKCAQRFDEKYRNNVFLAFSSGDCFLNKKLSVPIQLENCINNEEERKTIKHFMWRQGFVDENTKYWTKSGRW